MICRLLPALLISLISSFPISADSWVATRMRKRTASASCVPFNESFESWSGGKPSGWSTPSFNGDISQVSSPKSDGSYAIKLEVNSDPGMIYRDIDFTGCTTLKIDFLQQTNCNGVNSALRVGISDAGANITNYTQPSTATISIDISANTGSRRLALSDHSNGAMFCYIVIDKLQIY